MSTEPEKIRIPVGVSACLLGKKVRYDGGDKRQPLLTESLGDYFEWVPVCPEVEVGLGTPREPINLYRSEDGVALRTAETCRDLTRTMKEYADGRLEELGGRGLRGYILKSGSPSCGVERIPVYDGEDRPAGEGSGMFAWALIRRFPNLPVVEEEVLHDPGCLDHFFARLFAYDRWRSLLEKGMTPKRLKKFHLENKILTEVHGPEELEALDSLAARAVSIPLRAFAPEYERRFMSALARPGAPERHAETLLRLAAPLDRGTNRGAGARILDAVEEYRLGRGSLSRPRTLLKHHLKGLKAMQAEARAYLEPYPEELAGLF